MAISKRFLVGGVLLAVCLGGIGVASSETSDAQDKGAVASPTACEPSTAAKASRGRINAAADILGSSSTDRERALRGDCAVINDNDLRRICQGECSTINNSNVRRLCTGACGEITDPDIHRACQAG
jgi:hypothetical protein